MAFEFTSQCGEKLALVIRMLAAKLEDEDGARPLATSSRGAPNSSLDSVPVESASEALFSDASSSSLFVSFFSWNVHNVLLT